MMGRRKILALVLAIGLVVGLIAPGLRVQAVGAKLIAITFDDGPGPYTNRLLDGLKEKGVKATFFTLGQRAEIYPDEIRRIFAEGHQLCNHSYSHPELTAMSVSGALNQINTTNAILNRTIGGSEAYFLRAPYGSMNSSIRSQLSCPEIFWSVDTLDWKYRDSAYVKNTVISSAYDGAVVLMHDIHSTTVTGLLEAIDTLKSQGYEFVTVRELFRRRGVSMNNGQTYYECGPTGKDLGAAAKPTVTVEAVKGGTQVTLSTASAGAKIYYTLDGSAIDYKSKVYTGSFTVNSPCTIRAVAAYHLNGGRGQELTYQYTLPPAAKAEVDVENGTLSFSAVPEDETIFYTLDGTSPTENGVEYKEPFLIEPGTSIAFYTFGTEKIPTGVTQMYYSERGNLLADVKPSAWYFEAMDSAAEKGLLSGVGGHRFAPNSSLTRGMMVTILHRMSGEGDPEEGTNLFTDVKDGQYYAAAVEWAFQKGIASGVSETRFQPDRPVTRQEMARFMVKYYLLQTGEQELTDEGAAAERYADWEKVSDWAQSAVDTATRLGLMQGDNNGRFNPQDAATRAEGATVLCNLAELF